LPDIALDALDHGNRLFFLARVAAKGMGLAAFGSNLLDQWREFVDIASGDAGDITLAGKAAGDGAPVASPAPTTRMAFFSGTVSPPAKLNCGKGAAWNALGVLGVCVVACIMTGTFPYRAPENSSLTLYRTIYIVRCIVRLVGVQS
jgi:hypothetical protein